MKDRIIFHIDVNSAYLSWEAVERLKEGADYDLRDYPSVVSGNPKKRTGIILARSYKARPYGIKTGETLYSAKSKCKDLIVVPPRYDVYSRSSEAMVELLGEYTDHIERYSIDEVFVDATNAYTKHTCPIKLADELRHRIKDELGFGVCVGVSNSKLLAKTATDLRKPDFTNTLYRDELEKKLWHLPVGKLFMVGSATAPKLNKMGIFTIGDLANSDVNHLEATLKSHGRLIWNYANGIDDSVVDPTVKKPQGMGNSTTTPEDIDNIEEAKIVLLSLCENVGMRLREKDYVGQVISISIKFNDLSKARKQNKIPSPMNSTNFLHENASLLLEDIWTGKPIRQIGVSVSDITTTDNLQMSLFDNKDQTKDNTIDKTIDSLRERFGDDAIKRAVFVDSKYKHISGGVEGKEFQMMNTHL